MVQPTDAIWKRLRPQHLRLVLALSARGTLRGAADDLGVTQPAATKALQELEDIVGVSLYVRHARGVRPTVFGSAMIDFARVILHELTHLRDALAAIEAGDIGRVRIGTIMAPTPGLLTQAVVALKIKHPRLQITIRVDTSDVLLDALRQRQIEMFFGRIPEDKPSDDLIFEPIGPENLSIVSRPNLDRDPVHTDSGLSALADRRWILQPHPSPMRQIIKKTFQLQSIPFPTDVIETSSVMMTMSLLLSADMLAVLPTSVAEQYHQQGLLSILPVSLSGRLGQYGLVFRKSHIVTPAMRIFLEEIRSLVQQ